MPGRLPPRIATGFTSPSSSASSACLSASMPGNTIGLPRRAVMSGGRLEGSTAPPIDSRRRRSDGSVFVTAPAFTGGAGPLGARAGAAAASQMKDGPVSKAQGRFTIITNGEVLTNNSEDGTAQHPVGKQVHWDVGSGSSKIPEALIRLQ